jgi:transmembrane sensor
MPSNPESLSDEELAQTAAQWVVSRDRGLNSAESKALSEWLAADARHAAEYARIEKGWTSLDRIGGVPELASLTDAIETRCKSRRRRRRIPILAFGFLAAAAAVAGVLIWAGARVGPVSAEMENPAKNYVVLASTAHRAQLPDGSVAQLKGDSRIETEYVPGERRVRLLRGEAEFVVARNPERPFIVSAGPVTVRAVGTDFVVRLAPGLVEVLVTEGKVHVADAPEAGAEPNSSAARLGGESFASALVANERAVIHTARGAGASLTIDKPTPAELDEALAWESTRLVFDQTPLDQVVGAFNRYNTHKLTLVDPALRARTLTGVFRTDNLAGFIRLLPASIDVVVEANGDNQTLLHSAP